jgi:RNA polymerase sigma-70 factor (ECF subfamily)
MIRSAQERPEERRKTLEDLAAAYWKPLYVYSRRKGLPPEESKDAVQGFFAHLLGRDFLARLDPSRGRLRSFLKTALAHYLIALHRHESAQRRGGGLTLIPIELDLAEKELAQERTEPGAAFDRAWALEVFARASKRLEAEFPADTCPAELLRAFLPSNLAGAGPDPRSYAELSRRTGVSVPRLKSLSHGARARYRDLVREEVAVIVTDPGQIDAEIAALLILIRS